MRLNTKQTGEVSIFVVIFATLLVTIVTVSFVRIMVQGQQQATNTDLSQSAYDSAQAGVEDAKRAILQLQSVCSTAGADCDNAIARFNSPVCNDVLTGLTDITKESSGEVLVKEGTNNALNQAYTCVKVSMDTPDYSGSLTTNGSVLIPLKAVSAYNHITISWFSSSDLGNGNNADPAHGADTPLLAQAKWSVNRPSILRAQLIQFGSSGLNLGSLDGSASGVDASSIFLYPLSLSGLPSTSFSTDSPRRTPATNLLIPVSCKTDLSGGGYACSADITLPAPAEPGTATSFLRLTAEYNSTHYQVSMKDNADKIVNFDGVQPSIDSTGRANDLFRRVQSRVVLSANFPYPDAELNITGNLCKNFFVTNSSTDYSATGCTP